MFGGRSAAPADPIEKIGIRAAQEGFIPVELIFVKAGQVLLGKAAEDQIALACSAMPGMKQKPLAANLG